MKISISLDQYAELQNLTNVIATIRSQTGVVSRDSIRQVLIEHNTPNAERLTDRYCSLLKQKKFALNL